MGSIITKNMRTITGIGIVLLAVSGIVLWLNGGQGAGAVVSTVGLCAGGLLLFVVATVLQVRLDQGHDLLVQLIDQAQAKLEHGPENQQAGALIAEARTCLRNAEDAPVENVHAGPEINYLRQGIGKAQEALALLA